MLNRRSFLSLLAAAMVVPARILRVPEAVRVAEAADPTYILNFPVKPLRTITLYTEVATKTFRVDQPRRNVRVIPRPATPVSTPDTRR